MSEKEERTVKAMGGPIATKMGKRMVIDQLIAEELAAANKKFPAFASTHEGWAVLQEEFEEAGEEIEHMDFKIENLWTWIKDNQPIGQLEDFVADIRECAIKGIEELIQVAAMCDKFTAIGRKEPKLNPELEAFNKNYLSQRLSTRCKNCRDFKPTKPNSICVNTKNQETVTKPEWTCPEWHDA